MKEEQLVRNLEYVGMTCFVECFEYFDSDMSRKDVIEKLRVKTNFTEKSCASRTSNARSIIKANAAKKALQIIISSESPKISEATRKRAKELLSLNG